MRLLEDDGFFFHLRLYLFTRLDRRHLRHRLVRVLHYFGVGFDVFSILGLYLIRVLILLACIGPGLHLFVCIGLRLDLEDRPLLHLIRLGFGLFPDDLILVAFGLGLHALRLELLGNLRRAAPTTTTAASGTLCVLDRCLEGLGDVLVARTSLPLHTGEHTRHVGLAHLGLIIVDRYAQFPKEMDQGLRIDLEVSC